MGRVERREVPGGAVDDKYPTRLGTAFAQQNRILPGTYRHHNSRVAGPNESLLFEKGSWSKPILLEATIAAWYWRFQDGVGRHR